MACTTTVYCFRTRWVAVDLRFVAGLLTWSCPAAWPRPGWRRFRYLRPGSGEQGGDPPELAQRVLGDFVVVHRGAAPERSAVGGLAERVAGGTWASSIRRPLVVVRGRRGMPGNEPRQLRTAPRLVRLRRAGPASRRRAGASCRALAGCHRRVAAPSLPAARPALAGRSPFRARMSASQRSGTLAEKSCRRLRRGSGPGCPR